MILLEAVVEVLIGPMQHLTAKDVPNGPRIGGVLIGGHRAPK
jgi:hypothetical protein